MGNGRRVFDLLLVSAMAYLIAIMAMNALGTMWGLGMESDLRHFVGVEVALIGAWGTWKGIKGLMCMRLPSSVLSLLAPPSTFGCTLASISWTQLMAINGLSGRTTPSLWLFSFTYRQGRPTNCSWRLSLLSWGHS